jgi:hypothetical protein
MPGKDVEESGGAEESHEDSHKNDVLEKLR